MGAPDKPSIDEVQRRIEDLVALRFRRPLDQDEQADYDELVRIEAAAIAARRSTLGDAGGGAHWLPPGAPSSFRRGSRPR